MKTPSAGRLRLLPTCPRPSPASALARPVLCCMVATGDIYLTIVLNGAIHSVMYTYYFVSMHTDKIW